MKAKIEICTIVEHPVQHLDNAATTDETQKYSDLGGAVTDNEMESNDSTHRTRPELTTFDMALHGITHAFIILLLIIVTYFCFANGVSLFSWHPPFMIVGFLLFMTNAILAYSNNYYLTYKLSYASRVTLHWSLQVAAGVCILIGFLCIYFNKVNNNYPHFKSWHGYLGLVTVILSAGASSGGILAKYSFQARKILKPVIIKVLHAAFGSIAYGLAITTICLGLYSDWFHSQVNGGIIYLLIVLTILTGIVTISKPLVTIWSRVAGTRSN